MQRCISLHFSTSDIAVIGCSANMANIYFQRDEMLSHVHHHARTVAPSVGRLQPGRRIALRRSTLCLNVREGQTQHRYCCKAESNACGHTESHGAQAPLLVSAVLLMTGKLLSNFCRHYKTLEIL